MRFMLLKVSALAGPSDPDEAARFDRSLHAAGVLLGAVALHPPSIGARVEWSAGVPQVLPRLPGEEQRVIAHYWVIDAKSLAEAVEWAKRCPCTEAEAVEVRQVLEPGAPATRRAALATD